MRTQGAGHARRGSHLLLLFFPLIVFVGLAGCHHTPESAFSTDLLSRTDKFFDVAHVSGDVFVIVGYNGRILRTEDAGKTWGDVESPADWTLNQVSFIDDYGWAVGHRGTVIHTRDGGKTWTPQQVDTEKTIMSVSFVDKLHGRACGDESMFMWTDNGGETWNVERIAVSPVGISKGMELAIPDIIYYSIQFINDQTGWMVGEYGNIRYTTDGGKTWGSQHGSLLDELAARGGNRDVMTMSAFFRVNFSDPQHGVLVGGGGAIAATSNGGEQWHWVAREGDNPEVPRLHLYDVGSAGNNGKLLVVGMNGLVLGSENGGKQWQHVQTPEGVYTWINGLAFSEDGKGVLVGGKGTIMLSDDSGKTWRIAMQTEEELPEASEEDESASH